MLWNLRLKAAEKGIWKSAQMRRLLADAGLDLSAGKMSSLWAGTPVTIRLDDLDVICAVLDCDPAALLIPDFHNPTGALMGDDDRAVLADLAMR